MNWKALGYEVRRYANQPGTGWDYVARAPDSTLLYSGHNQEKAKSACIAHHASLQSAAA